MDDELLLQFQVHQVVVHRRLAKAYPITADAHPAGTTVVGWGGRGTYYRVYFGIPRHRELDWLLSGAFWHVPVNSRSSRGAETVPPFCHVVQRCKLNRVCVERNE